MGGRTKKTAATSGAAAVVLGCAAAVAASHQVSRVEPLRVSMTSQDTPVEPEYNLIGDMKGEYLQSLTGFDLSNINGFYGTTAAGPGEPEGLQGTETFGIFNSDHQMIGSFDAIVMHNYGASNPNLEVLVTHVNSGTTGIGAGDTPAIGSVFNFAGPPSDINNTYEDFAAHPPGLPPESTLSTDQGSTLTGNYFADEGTLDWTKFPLNLIVPPYDATAHIDAHTDSLGPLPLPNGDYVQAAPDDPEIYSGTSSNAPTAVDVQGTDQTFEILGPDKTTVIGTFQGQVVTTADMFTGHSEEIWVTGGQEMADGTSATSAELGRAAGDLPTTNSIFNILYYFNPQLTSMYSAYAPETAGGSSTLSENWNVFGLPLNSVPQYNALAGFFDGPNTVNLFDTIPLGNGLTITPDGTPDYTSINGLPNGFTPDNTMQGTQTFDITDHGHDVGSFTALITTYADVHGKEDESMLITGIDGPDGAASSLTLPTDGGSPLSGMSLTDGTILEYTDGGWWQTMTVDPSTFGLHPDAGAETQLLDIPFLGGSWTEVAAGSDGLLGLFGITF